MGMDSGSGKIRSLYESSLGNLIVFKPLLCDFIFPCISVLRSRLEKILTFLYFIWKFRFLEMSSYLSESTNFGHANRI